MYYYIIDFAPMLLTSLIVISKDIKKSRTICDTILENSSGN